MEEEKLLRLRIGPDHSHSWDPRFDIPENDGKEYDLAQHLIHQGFYDKALPIIDSLADRYPDNPHVQNLMGITFGMKDRSEAALMRFERALELSPPDCTGLVTDVLVNIGGAKLKLGQIKSAEKAYFRALEHDPNEGAAFANLGNIRATQERFQEATEFFERAVEIGLQFRPPKNYVTGSLVGIMHCFKRLGYEKEADSVCDLVRRLPPEHAYLITESLDPGQVKEKFYNRNLERGI